MKNVRFSRYYLLLCLPVLLALVGLFWGRPVVGGKAKLFDLDDLYGRYVSAETAYDASTFNPVSNGAYVTPVDFASTAVMVADGKGDVCGESDGFYGGTPPPGVNLGPAFFHGTYTVGSTDGRVVISICSDTAFCATTGACSTVASEQVGYLQSTNGNTLTTAYQIIPSSFSSGFLVHAKVWTKDASDQNHYF